MAKHFLFGTALLLILIGQAYAETKTAVFSVPCYWTGEAVLGDIDGVTQTRIGHLDGAGEIIEATYDSQRTNLKEMVRALKKNYPFYQWIIPSKKQKLDGFWILKKQEIQVNTKTPHFIDPKHSLRTRRPDLLKLGLTEAQKIKLNTWCFYGGGKDKLPIELTPEQQKQLDNQVV